MTVVSIHCENIFRHIMLQIVQLLIGQAALELLDPVHHRDDSDRFDMVLAKNFCKKALSLSGFKRS